MNNIPPLGKELGKGKSRVVYEHGENPNWVIKVSVSDDKLNQNLNEAKTWERLRGRPEAEWVAPVVDYCKQGTWLVMMKVEPITKEKHPKESEWPKWMDDVRSYKNWGWFEGRIVLCDYGYPKLLQNVRNLIK